VPVKKKIKSKAGSVKTFTQKFPASSARTKTLRYVQNNIHDFAWFADKRFIVNMTVASFLRARWSIYIRTIRLNRKRPGKIALYMAKRAIQFYSSEIGVYPYNIVSCGARTRKF
jgi:hypothetical protein